MTVLLTDRLEPPAEKRLESDSWGRFPALRQTAGLTVEALPAGVCGPGLNEWGPLPSLETGRLGIA